MSAPVGFGSEVCGAYTHVTDTYALRCDLSPLSEFGKAV